MLHFVHDLATQEEHKNISVSPPTPPPRTHSFPSLFCQLALLIKVSEGSCYESRNSKEIDLTLFNKNVSCTGTLVHKILL